MMSSLPDFRLPLLGDVSFISKTDAEIFSYERHSPVNKKTHRKFKVTTYFFNEQTSSLKQKNCLPANCWVSLKSLEVKNEILFSLIEGIFYSMQYQLVTSIISLRVQYLTFNYLIIQHLY